MQVKRNYGGAHPAEVLAAFARARAATVELIRSINESELQRRGFFAGSGQVTLGGLIHFLCGHDQQHLACMHWLLGKMQAELAQRGLVNKIPDAKGC